MSVYNPSKVIIDLFIKNEVIESEDKEIYEYGLNQGFFMIINIISNIILGHLFKLQLQCLVFLISYIILRIYADGYHTSNKKNCYLLSIIITFLVLLIIKNASWPSSFYWSITLSTSCIIFSMAPIEDKNKKLDNLELKVYRNRTRTVLFLEMVIFYVLMKTNSKYPICIMMAFIVLSIMLVLGRYTTHEYTN